MSAFSRDAISITRGEPVTVEIRQGRLHAIHPVGEPLRAEEILQRRIYVSPGFVDLQVNGLLGLDYTSPRLERAHVRGIVEKMATMGTTMHTATVITAPPEQIEHSIRTIQRARESDEVVKRAVPGFHLEGPFISPREGPRGAHPREYVREPSVAEYESWQEAAAGTIRIITVAPELPGAPSFIERVVRDGVVVSIGHTDATPEEIREAIQAGARMSTHLGNASSAMLPRLQNYIWEQLGADELVAGIIADGVHLPPAVLRVMARTKGAERLVLVSDIAPMTGMAPGEYDWGRTRVEVHRDGHLSVAGTPYLAGASVGQDRGIGVFRHASDWDLARTVDLCTGNPARILGLSGYPHRLEPGASADLTFFHYDFEKDTLRVEETFLAGQPLYRRNSVAAGTGER
ncbi:MAG: N-acetylglucosamine-6-phosphate deacetylase [Spirochaetaceae bacterium]|nr:MAG: N-acetylglucosamine-6-phosphate deacetylase [Spirochaetaceae bacterium]